MKKEKNKLTKEITSKTIWELNNPIGIHSPVKMAQPDTLRVYGR